MVGGVKISSGCCLKATPKNIPGSFFITMSNFRPLSAKAHRDCVAKCSLTTPAQFSFLPDCAHTPQVTRRLSRRRTPSASASSKGKLPAVMSTRRYQVSLVPPTHTLKLYGHMHYIDKQDTPFSKNNFCSCATLNLPLTQSVATVCSGRHEHCYTSCSL